MTMLPSGVKVHLAYGYTDSRMGMYGLALLVQDVLHQDPFFSHHFVFRGRKANLIKIFFLGHDRPLHFHQVARAPCVRQPYSGCGLRQSASLRRRACCRRPPAGANWRVPSNR